MDFCETCGQRLPKEQRRDDIRRVVMIYKMASGYEKDDKGWDKIYFGRYMRPAKMLIEFLGGWERAADAVQDIYEKLTSVGLTVTMETIVKHSADWKRDHQERIAKTNGELKAV